MPFSALCPSRILPSWSWKWVKRLDIIHLVRKDHSAFTLQQALCFPEWVVSPSAFFLYLRMWFPLLSFAVLARAHPPDLCQVSLFTLNQSLAEMPHPAHTHHPGPEPKPHPALHHPLPACLVLPLKSWVWFYSGLDPEACAMTGPEQMFHTWSSE